MLGKIEGRRRRGQQRMRWLDGIMIQPCPVMTQWNEFEQTPGDRGGQRSLAYCSPWGYKELDNLATEQQQQYVKEIISPR